MTDFRNILRQSAVYGLGNVATKAISVILFPLYSLHFSVAEYGVIVRTEALWLFLWAIANFGTTVALFKELHGSPNERGRGQVLSTMVVFYLAVGIAIVLVLHPVRQVLAGILLGAESYEPLISLAGVIALFEVLLFVPLTVMREQDRPWSYLTMSFSSVVIGSIGQVVAMEQLAGPDKLIGLYQYRLAGPIAAIFLGGWYLRKTWVWPLNLPLLRSIIRYSTPVFLSSLLALALSYSDRYLLGALASKEDVGLYGLGSNVAGLVNLLLVTPMLMVIHATMWKKVAEPNAKQFFSRLMTNATAVFSGGAVVVALLGYGIIRLFAQQPGYYDAARVVPFLSMSNVLFGMANVSLVSFYLSSRTDEMIRLYGVAFACNALTNMLLIKTFGLYGAAASSVVSNAILLGYSFHRSRKNYFFAYEWKRLILILLLAAVLIVTGNALRFQSPWLEFAARCTVCLLFPLGLFVSGIYSRTDWQAFRGMIPFKFDLR